MYRSHPVRQMCEDPVPGEHVMLVVEVDDADERAIRATVEALDGQFIEALPYDSFRVRLPETAVAEFCETDGLAAVETADVIGYTGDSGEDV